LSDRASGNFIATVRLLAGIVRFRKGPEDLPVSRTLLACCVLAGIGVRLLLVRMVPLPLATNPLALFAVDAGATLLFVLAVLLLARHPERFLQTATAIFGYQLLLLPPQALAVWLYSGVGNNPLLQAVAIVLSIALNIWALAISARILQSATGWGLFACVVLAIAGELLTLVMLLSVFPALGGSALPAAASAPVSA